MTCDYTGSFGRRGWSGQAAGPGACRRGFRNTIPFVRVSVKVIRCNRFTAERRGRTADPGASVRGRPRPARSAPEMRGGEMVRAVKGSDGKLPPVHDQASALSRARPARTRMLGGGADPRQVTRRAANSVLTAPVGCGSCGGAVERRRPAGPGVAVTSGSIAGLPVSLGGAIRGNRPARVIAVSAISDISGQSGSAIENPEVTTEPAMTYGVSAADLRRGSWYIREIGATTEAVGAR